MTKSKTFRMIKIAMNAYRDRIVTLSEALEIIMVYTGINTKRKQIEL